MNVAKSLDLLMARLGNRKAVGLRNACLNEMIFVQQQELELAPTLPTFIITERTTGIAHAGERRIKLPTDFLREVEGAPFSWINEDGDEFEIRKGDYDTLAAIYRTESDSPRLGAPERYDFRGDYFVLFPIPDVDYIICFPEGYYARQAQPEDSTTSENAWFKYAADLLIAKAGWRISTLVLKDAELASAFLNDQQLAENRIVRVITAQEEANRDRSMNPQPR